MKRSGSLLPARRIHIVFVLILCGAVACGPSERDGASEPRKSGLGANAAKAGAEVAVTPSATGEPEKPGEANTLPGQFLVAALPPGATVYETRGTDFDVYRIRSGAQPLAGIYLGNNPEFPGHARAWDEIENREESNDVTTISFTRGDALVSRERLFKAPERREPPASASKEEWAHFLVEQGGEEYGWISDVHVFTIDVREADDHGSLTTRAVTPDALAVFESLSVAPKLRAAWEARR
jgi:hypothetical protein